MIVELLLTIPVSGSIHERHFDPSAGANAWVRFSDEAGTEWVGVFGSGEPSRFYAAIPFHADHGQTALIIAGGQGYVVDTLSGARVRRTPWGYSQAAIAVPQRDFVIVADDTEVWAAGRSDDRPAWRRERAWYDYDVGDRAYRVALDGVRFDSATRDEVRGKVWEGDGWYSFRLLIPDLELTLEDFLSADWETFPAPPPAT